MTKSRIFQEGTTLQTKVLMTPLESKEITVWAREEKQKGLKGPISKLIKRMM